ncbi:hypothetical protein, partial [Bradyrhizobium sp.]|uniref:hypothetical protein n=1 Tax=Bradyrhizobium sp. TaxID=376 RepID=UPI0025C35DE5
SQLARLARTVCGERLIRERVQPSCTRVALDCRIELCGVKRLEPGAKSRKFARRELFDGLFDVFGGGHYANIASPGGA